MIFSYNLIRSKRRTLAIKITKDAELQVLAPKSMKKKDIEYFLEQKQAWILENLEKAKRIKSEKEDFLPRDGTKLLFYGKEYPLTLTKGKRAGFDGESFYIPETTSEENIIPTIKEIYRSLAKAYLIRRTRDIAEHFGESINEVKINSAKTRWGSCSSKRNINLSLFLIMAPSEAVDYCIIHEICHLKHMDHSKAFWSLVESRDPYYKKHAEELKALGKKLAHENW